MAGDFLLDTNIVAAVLNEDQQVARQLKGHTIFLSAVTIGELSYGVDASRQITANRARLNAMASQTSVLAVNRFTANWYGRIKNQLRTIGRPIPDNDIWIAATAAEHGLTLVSRDAHFSYIDGLKLVKW
jgi:tRNA(fMet)-specific endonuclease VapC